MTLRGTLGHVRVVVFAIAVGCGSQTLHVANPEPSITVVDVGAEPRRLLRHELKPDATERMELALKIRINTAFTNTVLETGHRSADFPTIKNVALIKVTSLASDGVATVSSEVENVTVLDDVVDPKLRTRVADEVAALKGSRVSWRMAPSGRISDVAFEASNVPASARNRLSTFADSLRETSVVFPDAAIGIGATWKVTSEQSFAGVTWNRTVTYRLKALTDSSATVVTQIVMRARSQALSVEPNATTKLTSGTSNADGELIVPLRGLVATGTGQSTSEVNLLIVRGRLRITSTVQTETLSSVKPLVAASPGGETPHASDP
jgi:hypothetical protein